MARCLRNDLELRSDENLSGHTQTHTFALVSRVCTPPNHACADKRSIFGQIKKALCPTWPGTCTHSVIAVLMTFFHIHADVTGDQHSAGSAGFSAWPTGERCFSRVHGCWTFYLNWLFRHLICDTLPLEVNIKRRRFSLETGRSFSWSLSFEDELTFRGLI